MLMCAGWLQVLKAYYQALRQGEARSASRTTIRMLESLVRVAQVGLLLVPFLYI